MADANDFTTPSGAPEQLPSVPTETGIQPAPGANIQTGAPAATVDQPIPVPPPKPRRRTITADRLLREIKTLDVLVAGLVLILAFVLASFAIQNHDAWMHLATGRLIAEGNYTFGDNPFTHPTTVYWANHSWLFDLVLYEVGSLGGGIDAPTGQALLVVFKALITVALAWVLMSIRRARQSLWVPALCTALAVLVLSPRLLLHPMCVSFLFLGLTLWLLNKNPGANADPDKGTAPASGLWQRPIWLIPPLFVLWVNLDSWFILGPLTVGLFLLGELLQKLIAPKTDGPDARKPGYLRSLALVFVVGLIACPINPFHYHAFTLPVELSYMLVSVTDGIGITDSLPAQLTDAGRTLQALTLPNGFLMAPHGALTRVYFQPEAGLNAAGLAYFVLLVAGLVSFLLLAGRWSWGRLLVWLVFAFFSLAQTRLIPFFAVVAGPIAALNFQDAIARSLGTSPRVDGSWVAISIVGRMATIFGCLALLVLAWPGLLHGQPDDPQKTHHVAWRAEPDEFLKHTAQQLHEVRGWAKLANGFNFSPDFAYYCAWYCPGERTYFDYRFGLFADRAQDFQRIRALLTQPDQPHQVAVDRARQKEDPRRKLDLRKGPDGKKGNGPEQKQLPPTSWKEIFRHSDIDHLVLASNPMTVFPILYRWVDTEQFPQPDVDGLSAIFAWRDPEKPGSKNPFVGHAPNLDALAFGPKTTDRAPARGVTVEPEQPSFFTRFVRDPAGTPWEAFHASLYVSYASMSLKNQSPLAPPYNVYLIANQLVPGNGVLGTWGPAANAAQTVSVIQEAMDKAREAVARYGKSPELADVEKEHLKTMVGTSHFLLRFLNRYPHRVHIITHRFPSKSALILAVRAARRAIAANPSDPDSYRTLAEAYQVLWKGQEDAWSDLALGETLGFLARDDDPTNARRKPGRETVSQVKQALTPHPFRYWNDALRQTVREAQVIAALQRAIAVRPALVETHLKLYDLYMQLHCRDAALLHLGEAVKHKRTKPVVRRTGEKAEAFQAREKAWGNELKAMEEEHKRLGEDVTERQRDFRLNAANKPLARKVNLAILEEYQTRQMRDPLGRGLALEALKILKNAKGREVTTSLAYYQLRLYVLMGQINELRDGLNALQERLAVFDKQLKREMKRDVRQAQVLARTKGELEFIIRYFQLFLAAMDGDYATADKTLTRLEKDTTPPPEFLGAAASHLFRVALYYEQLENQPFVKLGVRPRLGEMRMEAERQIVMLLSPPADLHLVHGLLALEQGETRKAADHFRSVVALTRDLTSPGARYDDRRIAEEYLKLLEKAK
jgi:hypothetical protein